MTDDKRVLQAFLQTVRQACAVGGAKVYKHESAQPSVCVVERRLVFRRTEDGLHFLDTLTDFNINEL